MDLVISPLQKKYILALQDSVHTEIFIGGSAGCFYADTLVATPFGYKQIADIKKGDVVISYNLQTKKQENKIVIDTFINRVNNQHIRVELNNGTEIKCTSDHKFLFKEKWVAIGDLCRRSLKQVKTNHNNQACNHQRHNTSKELEARELDINSIRSFEFYSSQTETYDICVADNHNFLITNKNIIVHNSMKSFTGCLWILMCALKYNGTRWFLARARLKSLKESTLLTFFEVCRLFGLEADKDYSYNVMAGVIKFYSSKSEVYLRDLFAYPSDPDFVSLGSTEYTGGFIDEMGEITQQAYNIIRSRIRYKLDNYNLIPKLLMGSNPCKTFVYNDFYRKYKAKKLEPYKKVILGTVHDNPFISDHYIENLKKLDEKNKRRLLYGDWEYDDDPSKLLEYEEILDIWTNSHVRKEENNTSYLTVDVARFGRDNTVIMYWNGFVVEKIYSYSRTSVSESVSLIRDLCQKHSIAYRNVIVDEDGVGGGVVDYLGSCRGFVNNSRSYPEKNGQNNYANLKTQCYFKLAQYIKENRIYIADENTQFKEYLIQDLEQIRRKDIDKDNKIRIVDKETIKENIGRSPDFSDCLMMRMYLVLFDVDSKILESDPSVF